MEAGEPASLPVQEAPVSLPVQEGDLEVPNDEELRTLRRVSDKIPFKAYTIAFVELVERMSFYGTTQVRPPHPVRPEPRKS
jgi:proton-dependent oligopeptide transporter, POT family